MSDPSIVTKIEEIVTLLKLGFAPQIQDVRKRIAADEILTAILEEAHGQPSGDLVDAVARSTKAGKSTVRARLADLVTLGALRPKREGASVSYQRTDLL